MPAVTILSDLPAEEDMLSFGRYSGPLLSILRDKALQTPLTIGIFGTWGSGKSTLLGLIDRELADDKPDEFLRVHFDAWYHRGEANLLVPLLHAIQKELEHDPLKRFAGSAKKIANILVTLGADSLLGWLSAGAVTVEKLRKEERRWLEEQGRVRCERSQIRASLEETAKEIGVGGARIVLFIDDLDRCEPDQIIGLLDAIKLFLDVSNVVILLAVDREVVDRGIAIRYEKFAFAQGRSEIIGGQYLEKMIQLPLTLLPLYKEDIETFLSLLLPGSDAQWLALLASILSPNPRRIKRALNILLLATEIGERTKALGSIDPARLARLVVLQVEHPDVFASVARVPEFLMALEAIANGDIKPGDETRLKDLVKDSEIGQLLAPLTEDLAGKRDTLLPLFKDSGFAKDDNLRSYLTLLGGQ